MKYLSMGSEGVKVNRGMFKIFRPVALLVIMSLLIVPMVMGEIDVNTRHKKSCPVIFNSSEDRFYIADGYVWSRVWSKTR